MFGHSTSSSRRDGLLPAQESPGSADFPSMAAEPAPLDRPPTQSAALAPAQNDVAAGVTQPRRRGGSRRPLLDVLVELRYISGDGLDLVEHTARTSGRTTEQVLLSEGAITPDQLARAV